MIEISKAIRDCCPLLQLGLLTSEVKVSPANPALLTHITKSLQQIQDNLAVAQISQLPIAQQTRRGYKATGKDPARYRPSAEALLRRVVQGKGLYQINNVVDSLNLISVQTAFSIGGYDMDQIKGKITLGIGYTGEPYQGIGRGDLNIAGLSVLRDETGPFGTPTSDSLRTSITESTNRFLMVFFNFEGSDLLMPALESAEDALREYAGATNIKIELV